MERLFALNAQMAHAQVSWPPRVERWMRFLFVTPPTHRVRHSRLPEDTDTTGALLTLPSA